MSSVLEEPHGGADGRPAPLRFRPMTGADLPAVIEIETQSYEFPWTLGIFRDCLRAGYRCRVVEQGGQVVGYGILTVAAGESHILNLCIADHARRRGLGRELLRRLLAEALSGQATCMLLEVRPSNRAAVALYEALGFNEIGRRKGYYPARGGTEDALIYARALF